MLPPWNDPFINTTQLFLVRQQPSSSSPNTPHELQASSIPVQTYPDPSNTMPPPSTNDGSRYIYGYMVDVSKLTPTQRQHHAGKCFYLHLLLPTLNHCLNPPYHHLIVDYLVEIGLT